VAFCRYSKPNNKDHMKKNLIVLGIAICGLAMTALPLSAQETKPTKPKPEHYSALAYLPSGAGPRTATPNRPVK
jgi:hypothetical protein